MGTGPDQRPPNGQHGNAADRGRQRDDSAVGQGVTLDASRLDCAAKVAVIARLSQRSAADRQAAVDLLAYEVIRLTATRNGTSLSKAELEALSFTELMPLTAKAIQMISTVDGLANDTIEEQRGNSPGSQSDTGSTTSPRIADSPIQDISVSY